MSRTEAEQGVEPRSSRWPCQWLNQLDYRTLLTFARGSMFFKYTLPPSLHFTPSTSLPPLTKKVIFRQVLPLTLSPALTSSHKLPPSPTISDHLRPLAHTHWIFTPLRVDSHGFADVWRGFQPRPAISADARRTRLSEDRLGRVSFYVGGKVCGMWGVRPFEAPSRGTL